MDFDLPAETLAFQAQARAVFEAVSMAEVEAAEARGELPAAAWQAAARAGLFRAVIDAEYGGDPRGVLPLAVAVEEMGALGLANALHILTMLAARCIGLGAEALKHAWLPEIAEGRRKVCLAVTEEEAGFNTLSLRTSAVRDGDGWILRGAKNYVSGADVADAMLVAARTLSAEEGQRQGLPRSHGLSLFLVDAAGPGIVRERLPVRGEGAIKPNLVTFDDARVDGSRLLGAEHQGAWILFGAFGIERVLTAAAVLGAARFCVRRAASHAASRKVFGDTAVGAYQSVQHPLADAAIREDAARLLIHRAAWAFDHGHEPRELEAFVNAAKYMTSELGRCAVDAAMKALGGRGFDERFQVIQLLEKMALYCLSPISDQLVLNRVAEMQLGLPRSY